MAVTTKVSGQNVAILLFTIFGSVSPAPVIVSPWGAIAGVDLPVPSGSPPSAYFAIPYALPPVGERRFSKPAPHPGPGEGQVYPAVVPIRSVCPQLGDTASDFVDEDCLTLDVYVPAGADGSQAVLIYLHGGSFTVGASSVFTPLELVVENDVIVVVIQYRLGIFGFLASGDGVVSGNYGLWDQHLAIKWVKDNIGSFGGDPTNMTIYGQSAGSVMAGFHLLSPFSKGLFSRVVMQSGFPSSAWAFNESPEKPFWQLAKAAGCVEGARFRRFTRRTPPGSRRVLECLREKSVDDLLQVSVILPESLRFSETLPWAPVVDGDFIPDNPLRLLADVDYLITNDVISHDVILAVTNDEAAYLSNVINYAVAILTEANRPDLLELFTFDCESVRQLIRFEIEFRYEDLLAEKYGINLDTAIDVIKFYYTEPFLDETTMFKDTANAFADISFHVPLVTMARSLATAAAAAAAAGRPDIGSTYVYQIDHFPARRAAETFPGMVHGEDIPYVFNTPFFPRDGFQAEDFALGTTLRRVLADFAKTGDPGLSLDPGLKGEWTAFTLDNGYYQSLGPAPKPNTRFYPQRVALWLQLLPDSLLECRSFQSPFFFW